MSERYQRLFTLPEQLYAEASPLLIEAGALLKDSKTGRMLAQIKFKSISPNTIKAVKISVGAFDVSGVKLRGIDEYQYLDLSVSRDSEFGQKNAVVLPESITRSFSCECTGVVFTDGTIWESNGAEWKPLASAQTLKEKLGALCEQYLRDTVNHADFVVTDDRDLWICTCGAINKNDEEDCHLCHANKKILTAALDVKKLEANEAALKKAEAEKKAEIERQELEKEKRDKKIAIITTPIICAIIAFIIVLNAVIIPDIKYNNAIALMNAGNNVEAYEALVALDGFKDSTDKANSIYDKYKVEKLNVAKAGDYVSFGLYEQDNNISNGQENIEWLVLDKKDGKVLVISKYALDYKQYNTSEFLYATWENCTLRKWLNNDFINTAFSDDEKAMISTETVSADRNPSYSTDPGNVTQDQTFLLSITEANKYFNSDTERQCKPTDYAVANGAEYIVIDNGNCWWWLRSPGYSKGYAANILDDGDVDEYGENLDDDREAVRPALWINLNH